MSIYKKLVSIYNDFVSQSFLSILNRKSNVSGVVGTDIVTSHICMYVHIGTHTNIRVHIYTHISQMHGTCMNAHMHAHINAHAHTHTHISTRIILCMLTQREGHEVMNCSCVFL